MLYLFETVKVATTIAPIAVGAATTNGATIDTLGFGDGMAIVTVGATTGSPSSFTVDAKVQESSAANFASPTDITGAAITQVVAAAKTAEIKIPMSRIRAASKRYVRVVITTTVTGGSSPTVAIGSVILLGNPERASKVANSVTGD